VKRSALIGLALAVLAAAGCGSGGTLTKKTLQKQAQSIESLAAEGSMVAQGAAQGRTTDPFVRVHAQYLQEAAKKIEQELGSSHASGSLEDKRRKGLKLAVTVGQELGRLHRAPGDRELAHRLQSGLTKDADDAKSLAK
jgi:hypothetical protein